MIASRAQIDESEQPSTPAPRSQVAGPSPDAAALLHDLLDPSLGLATIAQLNNLSLQQLADHLESATFQDQIDALECCARVRERLLRVQARCAAISALTTAATRPPLDPDQTGAATQQETARKAAATLLRLASPPPAPNPSPSPRTSVAPRRTPPPTPSRREPPATAPAESLAAASFHAARTAPTRPQPCSHGRPRLSSASVCPCPRPPPTTSPS